MRLDEYLTKAQHWSRKQVKQALKNGRIFVNNQCIQHGAFALEGRLHQLRIDGKEYLVPKHHYWMLYKPVGVLSATKDNTYQTVLDCLSFNDRAHVVPVGRLDRDAEGLMLLTDNGQLTYALAQAKHHVAKTYEVWTQEPLQASFVEKFKQGIVFDDGVICQPAHLEIKSAHVAHLTITEGKRHQVKKMMLSVGCKVERLKRIALAELQLDRHLKSGTYRALTDDELYYLYQHLEKEWKNGI